VGTAGPGSGSTGGFEGGARNPVLTSKESPLLWPDACEGAAPAGMNHRHDLFLGNDEKDRHTISCEDSQKGFFLMRLHAIAFTGFLNISVPHVENLIAVDLLHRNDAPVMNAHS